MTDMVERWIRLDCLDRTLAITMRCAMRGIKITLIMGAVLAATAFPMSAQNAVETVTAFHDALTTGDSIRALTLLASDVLIYENGSVEESKDEYRSHHLPIDIEFESSTSRNIIGQSSGQASDMAWVTTAVLTTGTFRGREIDTRGTETMLLRHTAEGWIITHIHWSSRSQ